METAKIDRATLLSILHVHSRVGFPRGAVLLEMIESRADNRSLLFKISIFMLIIHSIQNIWDKKIPNEVCGYKFGVL